MGGSNDTDVDETPEERELARVMTEKYGFYKDQIEPLIEDYKGRVRVGEGDYERVQGAAGAASGAAFDEARTNVDAQQRQRGVAPTSGSALTTAADMAAREGESRAGRSVDATNKVTESEYTGLQNVVALGSGKSAQAQQGYTDIARESARDSIVDAREAQYQNEARASNIGSSVGIGLRGYEASAANDSGGGGQSDQWSRRRDMDNSEYLTTPWRR